MRKTGFIEEKIVLMIQEADRSSVAPMVKKHGVSQQTLNNWRKQFNGRLEFNRARIGNAAEEK